MTNGQRGFAGETILVRTLHRISSIFTDVPESFAWIVFALTIANTLAYIVYCSDPVVQSDAWYFLDVFVRKALEGTLHVSDFLVQRGGLDHSQPLRKLILLADLRYFELDFRYEAIAGLICAGFCLLLLRKLVFWGEDRNLAFKGPRVWIWAALCVAWVSLNSTNIWDWTLVASDYSSYVLLLASVVALRRYLESGKFLLLIACLICFDIAADDVAILANVACLMALGLEYWRHSLSRKRVLAGCAILIICLIAVRIAYSLLYTPPAPPPGTTVPFNEVFPRLWTNFLAGGWWKWILVPLASSVCYVLPLRFAAGALSPAIQVVVCMALLIAHGWFWKRALLRTRPITAPAFAGIVLMLLFYAFVAAIIYGRIPLWGNNYVNEPRYVLAYSVNTVALLLMCADCDWNRISERFVPRLSIAAIASLLLLWQIPVSIRAWYGAPYLKAFEQKLAWQIGELARNPGEVPKNCAPELAVCTYPSPVRHRLIHLLEHNKLNVFSPAFQRATGLDPDRPPNDH